MKVMNGKIITSLTMLFLIFVGCSQDERQLNGEYGTEALYLAARHYKDTSRLPENIEELKAYCRRENIPIAFDSYAGIGFVKHDDGFVLYVDRVVSGQGIRVEMNVSNEMILNMSDSDFINRLEDEL